MSLVVQKYGGSSVADAASIKRVANRIVATKKAGHDVVVVVSAMGDTTDEFLDLAAQVVQQELRRVHAGVRHQERRFQLLVQVFVDARADEHVVQFAYGNKPREVKTIATLAARGTPLASLRLWIGIGCAGSAAAPSST